jgi:hypothetical protein
VSEANEVEGPFLLLRPRPAAAKEIPRLRFAPLGMTEGVDDKPRELVLKPAEAMEGQFLNAEDVARA